MRVLVVETMPIRDCMNENPIDIEMPNILVTETNLCVKSPSQKGACKGDSGGALVYNGELIGVMSFGADKCGSEKPDITNSVSSIRSWIHTETRKLLHYHYSLETSNGCRSQSINRTILLVLMLLYSFLSCSDFFLKKL